MLLSFAKPGRGHIQSQSKENSCEGMRLIKDKMKDSTVGISAISAHVSLQLEMCASYLGKTGKLEVVSLESSSERRSD